MIAVDRINRWEIPMCAPFSNHISSDSEKSLLSNYVSDAACRMKQPVVPLPGHAILLLAEAPISIRVLEVPLCSNEIDLYDLGENLALPAAWRFFASAFSCGCFYQGFHLGDFLL